MTWWKQWFTRRQTSVEVDDDLGRRLVGCLSAILRSSSVDALRTLARAREPSCDERTIDLEVFFFHRFLVVQSCAVVFSQSVMNRAAAALYKGLEVLLTEDDVGAQSYDAQFIRRWISTTGITLAELEKVWVVRAREYEEPFYLDADEFLHEEFRKKHPGHLPYKRMVTRFSHNFGEASDAAKGFDALPSEAVNACVQVGGAFGVLFKAVGEEMRAYFGKGS